MSIHSEKKHGTERKSAAKVTITHALITASMILISTAASAVLVEDVVSVPVKLTDKYGKVVEQNMVVTIFHDDSVTTKQPFIVMGHGRPKAEGLPKFGRAAYRGTVVPVWVQKGYTVVVPTRVGYGATGGPDVEEPGNSCSNPDLVNTFKAMNEQIVRVVEYTKTLPYVNPEKGLIAGHSYGGTQAITVAALNIPGILGAVNFAGGAVGKPAEQPGRPCRPDKTEDLFAEQGKTSRIPTLWFYSANDRYWGETLPKEWFDAFVKKGGKGEFITVPACKEDGHNAIAQCREDWQADFNRFTKSIGLISG